ncbi:MAG TPA: hypothetical protein PK067_02145 [Kaistella chaponensis]|nr:hypothetical protein [Kaistella chaponensis]
MLRLVADFCGFSLWQNTISLTHDGYFADEVGVTKRKSSGGPRCPKRAMVKRLSSLQHRHFLSNVLGFAFGIWIFKVV